MTHGKFVMVDGLDASGKGTIVRAFGEWASRNGLRVLYFNDYCMENHRFPEFEEVSDYDAIVTDEPTYSYVGQAIREEMIKNNDRKYSAISIAQAFALDREILYKRLVIPALKAGKYIFQERGVISSVVYQPVHERIPLSEIINLPGNRLALQNSPNLLIILKVSADVIIQRLGLRAKKDDSIYENLIFQRKLEERYSSDWLRQLFEQHGSKVVYIDTNPPKAIEETKEEAIRILEEFIAEKKHN